MNWSIVGNVRLSPLDINPSVYPWSYTKGEGMILVYMSKQWYNIYYIYDGIWMWEYYTPFVSLSKSHRQAYIVCLTPHKIYYNVLIMNYYESTKITFYLSLNTQVSNCWARLLRNQVWLTKVTFLSFLKHCSI